jgi:hypothetical protein
MRKRSEEVKAKGTLRHFLYLVLVRICLYSLAMRLSVKRCRQENMDKEQGVLAIREGVTGRGWVPFACLAWAFIFGQLHPRLE